MTNTTSFVLTSYNIHKGMSPMNRQVKIQGIAQALDIIGSDCKTAMAKTQSMKTVIMAMRC